MRISCRRRAKTTPAVKDCIFSAANLPPEKNLALFCKRGDIFITALGPGHQIERKALLLKAFLR